MPARAEALEGVLPVDKPAGPTSHDVVARARRALGERRIGHTGTLDPFASGLLLLCVGRATRIAEYLSDMDKTYRATMRMGTATDTDDLTGAAVAESDDWRTLDDAAIRAAFTAELGRRDQRPPAYSARKIGGERAYKRARRGEDVELPSAEIDVHAIDIVAIALPDVTFDVRCSTGTYIRAIARDIGERLGSCAHLTALRRTAIGAHDVDHAIALDALDDATSVAGALIATADALRAFPRLEVDDEDARHLTHGRPIDAGGMADAEPVIVLHDGTLLAVARAVGGRVEPRKVFV